MAFNTDPSTDQEINQWFLTNPPVPERTFEIALVLGGTVSAGAYTAGALDFLMLDQRPDARPLPGDDGWRPRTDLIAQRQG